MKINQVVRALSLGVLLVGTASADTAGSTAMLNVRWMNAVVNKTPVAPAACPEINTDIYGSGFQVTLRRSFYGTASATGSRWFPSTSIWSSVGVGPIKNDFSITSGNINKLNELEAEKQKNLPTSYEEVSKWKVGDSAYWESEGGVSLYVGAGIAPVDIGLFAVATGGWVNYFQKTGPNRVYVEVQKKKIRSVNFGVGVGRPNVSIDRDFESQKGYAYEFVLDNQTSIEAFERFMAGDMTKAQELTKVEKSGVNKISNLTESYSSWARGFLVSTPFVPVLSFKANVTQSDDVTEEKSVWDEDTLKDTGAYVKQRDVFVAGIAENETKSFMGGKVVKEAPSLAGRVHTETLFGNFKYAFQSNFGQEKHLRRYINKVKGLTGLVDETCATVPAFQDSLGFNQVVLEVNWSDDYVQELVGLRNSKSPSNLLQKIKASALNYQADKSFTDLCTKTQTDGDVNNNDCAQNSIDAVNASFAKLESYSNDMKKNFNDKKEFARLVTNFGQEIWKTPAVFKAFYERGKLCGQDFRFEVSGQRLTRYVNSHKYTYSAACSN